MTTHCPINKKGESSVNTNPSSMIRQLRSLMPLRALEEHEAHSVAERQAIRLLEVLGQREPAADVGLIAELPRVEVKVEPNLHVGGISGFSQWARGRWRIAVNRDDTQPPRRFTLPHSLKPLLHLPFMP